MGGSWVENSYLIVAEEWQHQSQAFYIFTIVILVIILVHR